MKCTFSSYLAQIGYFRQIVNTSFFLSNTIIYSLGFNCFPTDFVCIRVVCGTVILKASTFRLFPQVGYTEKDVLQCLPTMDITLGVLSITDLLSTRATQKLGDFEIKYQYDLLGKTAEEQ